ncbi:TPA: phospholipase [Pseudomonas aeruginosa]|uniref:phospholipase n=1 Tax=Pseudomonas aeruginosa TaxID=287 RepID=UPI001CC140FC|nr:phospholipase [Pseudomonas aeruginosa]MCT1269758.1 phospholipase [Pseudomonas aeruginosa]HBO2545767.1 phospholipase [Pseudomonas aeruginosa]HEK2159863.1 phospholipase [Pseudomonas aeruginosa]HEN8647480.1 phospholipase [Pseudomonas aeruginosa]HEN8680509.1 phospholipase [Pseudomonas aeruginosa]
MKLLLRCLLLGAWVVSPSLWAWSNHTVGSYLALRELAAIREAPEVEVESLEAFLAAERGGLAALLDEQEAYARAHIGNYPARPDALRFAAEGEAGDLRQAFLAALRVNPEIRLALALQPLPGQDQPQRPHLKPQEVLVFQNLSPWTAWRFIRLEPGERVAPLAVLATAADEPDYGHDINLFSDNPGEAGQRYGFGTQPFGDPRFEFSSQAPFHMGFYHEAAVIYIGAPFLARAWPEWRAYQYFGLSRFAFANGHPYWGYRFLGWGMHYIQDITQPYHSTPLPGASLAAMLQMEGKALLGYPEEKQAAIERVANRHTAVEKYQFDWLRQLLRDGRPQPMLDAYADTRRDGAYPAYSPTYLRDVVAAESNAHAAAFDAAIGEWLAARPASAAQDFSESNQPRPEAHDNAVLNAQLIELIGHFGAHSRNIARAALETEEGGAKE